MEGIRMDEENVYFYYGTDNLELDITIPINPPIKEFLLVLMKNRFSLILGKSKSITSMIFSKGFPVKL